MPRTAFIFSPSLVLLSFLLFAGCAVFEPVGDAISRTYQNTVAYFNLYYNARHAFRDAETEILAAARDARGRTSNANQPLTIPPTAQKNLDLVIDKCSNILAYHNKSAYVDGTLMMVGKAYYYRAEYAKAERKFTELITQFPGSSLLSEAQLWYARTEQKLGQRAEARKGIEELTKSLADQGQSDILSDTYSLMAAVYVDENAEPTAIEYYEKAANVAQSDERKAEALSKESDLCFARGDYQKAIELSREVEDVSDDFYLVFQSRLRTTISYRSLKKYDMAVSTIEGVLGDYRFKDYKGQALFERANILFAEGKPADAVDLCRAIDTLYARTDVGAKAAFVLAEHYEKTTGEYDRAREYYTHVLTVPGSILGIQSAKKITALNSYFTLRRALFQADSIYAAQDTMDNFTSERNPRPLIGKDSAAKTDTLKKSNSTVASSMSLDSLKTIEARSAAGLGELFYSDLSNPDSALYWLKYALERKYEQNTAPRILYILSELASAYPEKSPGTSEQYRAQLIKDFPDSYFASQTQGSKGTARTDQKLIDHAAEDYAAAELLIEGGKNNEALAALQQISRKYPTSDYSAKSEYAIGWLYENRLERPDSAVRHYKLLISEYPASQYARIAGTRMLDTLTVAVPVKADTVSSRSTPLLQMKDTVGVRSTVDTRQGTANRGAPLSRRARVLQSEALKKIEKE